MSPGVSKEAAASPAIHRNLGMELVRVTEAAALSAAPFMGRGDGKAGDAAAVDAMRTVLGTIEMDGVVVIGEGEKDRAPMLYNGEVVGTGVEPALDLAVDPVEGTRLLALGQENAIAVIAAAERGAMWQPGPSLYLKKLVVGEAARDVVDIRRPTADNLRAVAKALGRPIQAVTVFVLDKPRHHQLIREIREVGARVSLHTDGDVMGGLLAVVPGTGIDVLMGTGGTPEGVILATAVKALRGGMQAVRDPQLDDERTRVEADLSREAMDQVIGLDDLLSADDAFFAATAITDSPFLQGVRYTREMGVSTESLVVRASSGSMRFIRGAHRLDPEHIFGEGPARAALSAAIR